MAAEETVGGAQIIRVHAEEAAIVRERTETGRARIRVVAREHEEVLDVPLEHVTVEVERVPIGMTVDTAPPVRQDGETTIISLVEEVLIVKRQLMLTEELHVRRVHTIEQHSERVSLRKQEAIITREPVDSVAVGAEENLETPKEQNDNGL